MALCPLSELGFLRISSHKKAINAPMAQARKVLETFIRQRRPARIDDDLPPLEARAETSEQVTDQYLAALAERHGYRLATLDEGISTVVFMQQRRRFLNSGPPSRSCRAKIRAIADRRQTAQAFRSGSS